MKSLVWPCRSQLLEKQVKMSNKVIRAKNLEPKGEVRARNIYFKVSSIKCRLKRYILSFSVKM